LRAVVDVGVRNIELVVIATRGERLALCRARVSGGDQRAEAFALEMLSIVEIGGDGLISAAISFDVDDIDAAFEVLDARYLAGEGAAHAHTWSVITQSLAGINRHELPATTPDWINMDHRRVTSFAPGDLFAFLRASWDQIPDIVFRIETVHRLSDLGTVVTLAVPGTSQEGFEAEWRYINVVTVEGDLINDSELFDDTDIDAALARFDELSRPARRLENAASQMNERFLTCFVARDWDAMATLMVDGSSIDDRRRTVNAGLRRGRDAEIASMRAIADLGVQEATSAVIATRGERLALSRDRFMEPEGFLTEVLGVIEINADERIVAVVVFDVDNADAAFEELDARYLGGEAAAHQHTWSFIAGLFAALNRREVPKTTPDWVNIDHRRATAFAPGEAIASLRATWDLTPDFSMHIETVHRLNNVGAVTTLSAHGSSQDGFDAEWREIALLTVDGDLINRCETFDEADLDAALARFDELNRPAPRQENAASRKYVRFNAYLATRDWDAMAAMLADDVCDDDRRRVVSGGIRRGRDAQIANLRAVVDVGVRNIELVVIATRGARLALSRARVSGGDQQAEAFALEMLSIVEIDTDDRIAAGISFDIEDIDAAFEELDTRYVAGEAAAHAHTWSVVAGGYAAFNRHEVPAITPDWVNIDHRRAIAFTPGELIPYIHATWDVAPDISIYIEAVHRLSDLGAVVTQMTNGTSQGGFDAEWQETTIITVEGDLINRIEIFDRSDIETALARFDELSWPARQLENAATRVFERFEAHFAARDWTAMAEILAEDMCNDDRRRVVGSGVLHGRDTDITHMRAIADVGAKTITSTLIATRGERLVLRRVLFSGEDQGPEEFQTEILGIVDIDVDNRIVARVSFDPDDFDAAVAELDARYVAGEAVDHARTWSVITQAYASFNRHEQFATDWLFFDHRRGTPFASNVLVASAHAAWDLTPDLRTYVETMHRLSNHGAVVTHTARGTSPEGFDAEWRMIQVLTVEDNRINRCEIFDEDDLDAALTRFDELSTTTPALENAAIRTWGGLVDAFNRRDPDGFWALAAAGARYDDRRKGLRDEGPARFENVRSLFEQLGGFRLETETVAVRGSRLGLTRDRHRDVDDVNQPITIELLTLTEVADDGLVRSLVLFDPDNLDGAMAELTSRWIGSGEIAHPEIIEAVCRISETVNRHDWDAIGTRLVGTTYISHRQLGLEDADIAVFLSSVRMLESLAPDFWMELAEVITYSETGLVAYMVMKGTSTDGVAIEIPTIHLTLLDGERVTHLESFDHEQRDLALARFRELNRPA
jgi:hypothetical protein